MKREDKAGVILICTYVDDILYIGDRKALKKFTHEIQKHFNIVEGGMLDEYIGCEIKKINDNEIILKQLNLIRKIKRNFEMHLDASRSYQIPVGT